MWDAQQVAKKKVKEVTLSNNAGSKARFVSWVKLVEYMGERSAANYASACDSERHNCVRYNAMGQCSFYNYVEDVACVMMTRGFRMQEEQQSQGPGAGDSGPLQVSCSGCNLSKAWLRVSCVKSRF